MSNGKGNGKVEVITEDTSEYAEIMMDDYTAAEVAMLQDQIDEYRKKQSDLEQEQANLMTQLLETKGGAQALEEVRDARIRKFAEDNKIEAGQWNLSIREGKFVKL